MFENKDVASSISNLMLELGAKLDDSVAQVQQTCSPAEFERYRTVIGKVMGEMLLEIMNPIYFDHPELKPEGLDDNEDYDSENEDDL